MIYRNSKIFFLFVFLFFPFIVGAATIGEIKSFYIDPAYDVSARQNVSGQLVLETSKLYFYIEDSWWDGFSTELKNEIKDNLALLGDEFSNKIYPVLSSNYGSEWNPGIDNDVRITVLFHQLKRGAGGYFNSGNEYSKYEVPVSNEREMIYLNSDYLTSPLLKRLFVHEFTHLITFNQKEKINNVEEDVWLNEARAEYAITLCGYDDVYSGSNLQKRVVEFLKNPNDSLTNWQGTSSDYGVLNIFTQYMVDQYGVKILNDSLHSRFKGIDSLNQVLSGYGYRERFSDVFNNWSIAVMLNDCSYDTKYCFKNVNLRNLKIIPVIDSLPENSPEIYVNYFSNPWAGHWDKITNAKGDLSFDFSGEKNGIFNVNYVLCDKTGKCEVMPLTLSNNQTGRVTINDFDSNYSSIVAIFFAKNIDYEGSLQFSLHARASAKIAGTDDETARLLTQIDELKKKIAELQALLSGGSCSDISINLYPGLTNNAGVSCLQKFLKSQGSDIYPEGLITGNFFLKTKKAVIRFQEKYAGEILTPIGLSKGTGIVGLKTREKINKLLLP